MLQQLSVVNYGIIDEMVFNPQAGLNIVTGETGAGKSLLIGAIGLILGNRVDTSVLKNKETKAVVEAIFKVKNAAVLQPFFEETEIDSLGDEVIIRKEIAPNGKSRSFVNDTSVNVAQLRQVTTQLVDLHQQFDTLALQNEQTQLEFIDAVAGTAAQIKQFRIQFTSLKQLQAKFEMLLTEQEQFDKEKDYNQFLLNELNALQLQPNTIENWEAQYQTLSNATHIIQQLQASNYVLAEQEQGALPQIRSTIQNLESIKKVFVGSADVLQRLQQAYIELKDIASEISMLEQEVNIDEAALFEVTEQLNIANTLLKKHKVQTTADLLAVQAQLEAKVNQSLSLSTQILELESQIQLQQKQTLAAAQQISAQRLKAIPDFEKSIQQILVQMGMLNAAVRIELHKKELTENGIDEVLFLFDANNTSSFKPIAKVASGGELSRLMLAIKTIIAKAIDLPVLIFDEIDTGISGQAAKQVATLLQQIAETQQVISITHLPQIAAKANQHFNIYKNTAPNGMVQTRIQALTDKQRITTVAQMIDGENPSNTALANAQALINAS